MKYYKITNETECHNGLRYRDGLNVDPLPFRPQGDCMPGGIYFASKDILAFLDYGPWIREVTLPEGEAIYENLGYVQKFKAHSVILGKRRRITIEVIKELLEEGVDPKAGDSYALRWAAQKGHLEIVKLLLPISDPKANKSQAIRYAAQNGHLEIVKFLLPVSDPKADKNHALRYAAHNGYLEIVKLLLPLSDPKEYGSEALRLAAAKGYLEIVKLLLPVSDLKIAGSYALRDASAKGHLEIVNLLRDTM